MPRFLHWNKRSGFRAVLYKHIDILDSDAIARVSVKVLMDSPKHKDNIVNPVSTHVGIGAAYGYSVYYVTQDFW